MIGQGPSLHINTRTNFSDDFVMFINLAKSTHEPNWMVSVNKNNT